MLIICILTLLLLLPFFHPNYFWWLIFLFPSVLFLHRNNFKRLYRCGIVAYLIWTIHACDLYTALYAMHSGSEVSKWFLIVIINLYASLPFMLLLWIIARIKIEHFWQSLTLYTLSIWLYFVWIEYALLVPIGHSIGYPFFNPLLPLAAHPALLWLLPFLKMWGLLLFFCITTSSITYAFLTKNALSCLLAGALLSVWQIGFFIPTDQSSPPWLSKIARIPIIIPSGSINAIISDHIHAIKERRPTASIFILPESSCQQTPCWNDSDTLIMGGFLGNSSRYNTLFWFGQSSGFFCKKLLVPLTEIAIGPFWQAYQTLTPATNPRPSLSFEDLHCTPYICSELFFSHNPDDHHENTLLCITNDWWFRYGYLSKLMLHVAQLRALEWQRPLLYVSYYHGAFVSSSGIILQNSLF